MLCLCSDNKIHNVWSRDDEETFVYPLNVTYDPYVTTCDMIKTKDIVKFSDSIDELENLIK